jgi:hypothetical protein
VGVKTGTDYKSAPAKEISGGGLGVGYLKIKNKTNANHILSYKKRIHPDIPEQIH